MYLTEEQVAERWQCKPRMVRELWARREITAVKVGRLVRYPLAAIEAYEGAHTVPAVAANIAMSVFITGLFIIS